MAIQNTIYSDARVGQENSRKSPHKGDVGRYALLVLPKALAEMGSKQFVFDPYTDLGASDEQNCADEEQRPGSNHQSNPEQQTQHRAINRMTDEAIGAGGD